MEHSSQHSSALPLVAVQFNGDLEELFKYIATFNRKTELKLAPSYTLYLLSLNRASLPNCDLRNFLMHTALSIHHQINESERSTTDFIFWLANACELYGFLKYDQCLMNYSEEALDILENIITSVFLRLFTLMMNYCEENINLGELENITKTIDKCFYRMHECMVNAGLINQLVSYLVQWIGDNLLANSHGNIKQYEKYFISMKISARKIDDLRLVEVVERILDDIEDSLEKRKNKQQTKTLASCNLVELNWKRKGFLVGPFINEYLKVIEEGVGLLSQIDKDKLTLSRNFIPPTISLPDVTFTCHILDGVAKWLADFINGVQEKQICYFNQSMGNHDWDVNLKKRIITYNLNLEFILPPYDSKKQKTEGAYIVWHTFSESHNILNVGDKILSINNKKLYGGTQKDGEKVIKSSKGNVKIDVLKADVTWMVLKDEKATSLSHEKGLPTKEEQEENECKSLSSSTDQKKESSENQLMQDENFMLEIKKKVEDLDEMLQNFHGVSEIDRNFVYMKEIMMRSIIKLDNMESTSEKILKTRRDTIYFIQQKIQQLKSRLKSNQEIAKCIPPDDKKAQSCKDINSDKALFPSGDTRPEPTKHIENTNTESKNLTVHPLKESIENGREKENSFNNLPATEQERHQKTSTEIPKNFTVSTVATVPTKKVLIWEKKYDLDEYGKKYVSIGIYPYSKFARNGTVVKLSDTEGHSVILELPAWRRFLGFQDLFRQHFKENHQPSSQLFDEYYYLQFETTHLVKVVTILRNSDYVSLDEENLSRLYLLSHLLDKYIDVIIRSNFDYYFYNIICKASLQLGDRVPYVHSLVKSDCENNHFLNCAYAVLEIIQFYPEILYWTIQEHKSQSDVNK